MLTLNDKDTGAPVAYMSANILSAYRTGAVPGVGYKYFSKEDSKVVGVVGPGVMSKTALAAIMTVRPNIETIKVKGRGKASLEKFIAQAKESYPTGGYIRSRYNRGGCPRLGYSIRQHPGSHRQP